VSGVDVVTTLESGPPLEIMVKEKIVKLEA
jgi:hypothetical protein